MASNESQKYVMLGRHIVYEKKNGQLVPLLKDEPTKLTKPKDNGKAYFQQCFMRGLLGPSFKPPTKTCPRCYSTFAGVAEYCLPCRKAASEAAVDVEGGEYTKFSVPDVQDCDKCASGIAPARGGWCTDCFTVMGSKVPMAVCKSCLYVPPEEQPFTGGLDLWCARCGALEETWLVWDDM